MRSKNRYYETTVPPAFLLASAFLYHINCHLTTTGVHMWSQSCSIHWVHAWAKSLGAVGLQGGRWTPAAGADVAKPTETKVLIWPHPTCPLYRPWHCRPVFDRDPDRPCPSSSVRLQSRKLENILRFTRNMDTVLMGSEALWSVILCGDDYRYLSMKDRGR